MHRECVCMCVCVCVCMFVHASMSALCVVWVVCHTTWIIYFPKASQCCHINALACAAYILIRSGVHSHVRKTSPNTSWLLLVTMMLHQSMRGVKWKGFGTPMTSRRWDDVARVTVVYAHPGGDHSSNTMHTEWSDWPSA